MRIAAVFAALALLLPASGRREGSPGERRILVFSKTAGFRHESIPDGIAVIGSP